MNEVLRQEKKFSINVMDGAKLRKLLDRVMISDEHNGVQGYTIRSLYFDTPDNDDFMDKIDGLELRRKIRLRIYDPENDFAMLEMKQKEGAYQKKRSLRLSRTDAFRLCAGDYGALLQYEEPFAAECYGLMSLRCYRPKTIVEYLRRAYIARENHIRVTIDSQIRATESCYDIFSKELGLHPVQSPFQMVLEVKYNGFMLSYIKALLDQVERSELSVSKYCLARGVTLDLQG